VSTEKRVVGGDSSFAYMRSKDHHYEHFVRNLAILNVVVIHKCVFRAIDTTEERALCRVFQLLSYIE